jgi:peptide/nickel transport system ATP-binding protein
VRDLKTYFFADEGVVKAVDGASFDVYPGSDPGHRGGERLRQERDRPLDPAHRGAPGRIVGRQILMRRPNGKDGLAHEEEIDLAQLDPTARRCAPSGARDRLVFQEPMTSFSPVHTIGNQIIETIRCTTRSASRRRESAPSRCCAPVGIPKPERA